MNNENLYLIDQQTKHCSRVEIAYPKLLRINLKELEQTKRVTIVEGFGCFPRVMPNFTEQRFVISKY